MTFDLKDTGIRYIFCGFTDYQMNFLLVHNAGKWSKFVMIIFEFNACI